MPLSISNVDEMGILYRLLSNHMSFIKQNGEGYKEDEGGCMPTSRLCQS